VTHDQAEALSLSDRVCVMHDGVIQQFAAPEEIYHRPATSFVASFIGKPNRLAGTVKDGAVDLGDGLVLQSTGAAAFGEGTPVDIFIRQEAVTLSATAGDDGTSVAGTVVLRSFSGAQVQYVVRLGARFEVVVEVASAGEGANLAQGDEVFLTIRPQDIIVIESGAGA
jgi:ABC-type Fe3+/spermidine/putrescine transport system ATPase subunit